MVLKGKRGYEFSFTWIFTIFVGAAVIFFAIYFAMQIIESKNLERNTVEGKSLGILLTPIETQTEQGKFSKIILSEKTNFFFDCEKANSADPFGSQLMRISIKSSLGKQNDENTNDITFHNKYIFSNSSIHGDENVYALSKPFFLPFKVADLLMVWSDNDHFCFDLRNAPADFRKELDELKLSNVRILNSEGSCTSSEKSVCFSGSCDITVGAYFVSKSGNNLQYIVSQNEEDPYALLLAAIFSDPETYECQLQRLLAHTSILTDLYAKKAQHVYIESGCGKTVEDKLRAYQQLTSQNPINLKQISDLSKEVNDENAFTGCSVF